MRKRIVSLPRLPSRAGLLAWVALAAGLLWFAPALAMAQQGYWHFHIHPVAAISGSHVHFGDIAAPLTARGKTEWEKLSGQRLWPAPEAGRSMTLSRDRVLSLLAQYMGNVASACRAPSQVVLQGGGDVVLEEELRSRIVTFLTSRARLLGEETVFRDYRLPSHIFLPHVQDTLDIELTGALQPGRNSLRFVVRAVDGSIVRRLTGTVFLDVWQAVPCAARPLNTGTSMQPEDISFQRKNLAYLREAPWDGTGGPWQIRTPVGMDQVIYRSSLQPLPTVRKGDHVLLVYEGEMVRLQIVAQAMEDGAIGETIPVRNLQNNSEVLARIRDFETVVVR
jgi:flagellar basal body P-ring formation protein FlgA